MRSHDPLSHFRRPSKQGAAARGHEQAGASVPASLPPPPEWASFFGPEEFAGFIRTVRDFFEARGDGFALRDGLVDLEGQGSIRLGLANLAQFCHQHDRSTWPSIVAAHFGSLVQAQQEEEELGALAADFEKASALLAVRIFPRGHLNTVGPERLIFREDLEGTVTALVFDMPATVRTVSPEHMATWERSAEDLLALGLKNVRSRCHPQVREVDLGGGVVIRIISGVSFMTASHALLLDGHAGCVGRFGALVGVPHRHAVLSFPIEDRRVIAAASHLLPAVIAMEKEGPGSISSRLYWYRDGRFTDLPYSATSEGYRFHVPHSFAQALEEMPQGPDGL